MIVIMNIERIKSSAIKFKIIPMEEHFHILCAKRHADILEYMFNHHIEYDYGNIQNEKCQSFERSFVSSSINVLISLNWR